MKHIMLDLETMSTKPNAAIVAIGACELFPKEGAVRKTFYEVIDLQSCINAGLKVDGDTIYWWLRQTEHARGALQKDKSLLPTANINFKEWATGFSFPVPQDWPCIWGNGASFDNVILRSALETVDTKTWPYWQDRCYRTIKSMYPEIKLDRTGTHHNALDDAISQAQHLEKIVRQTGLQVG